MNQEHYSILYSSMTGNTKLLADTIRAALPEEKCDYFGVCDGAEAKSDLLYVGFWTDKGNADAAALSLLAKLKNKKVNKWTFDITDYDVQGKTATAVLLIRKDKLVGAYILQQPEGLACPMARQTEREKTD